MRGSSRVLFEFGRLTCGECGDRLLETQMEGHFEDWHTPVWKCPVCETEYDEFTASQHHEVCGWCMGVELVPINESGMREIPDEEWFVGAEGEVTHS